MKVGDLVRVQTPEGERNLWPESEGQVGVVVQIVKRIYIPAAKVFILGQVAEFDQEELVNESR
mgnify:FL=1